MTCALKGDKIYFYGGFDKQKNYNKNIYSIKLEGLKLHAEKAKWKLERAIKNMPDMSFQHSFDMGDKSNKIFNFGNNQPFPFNWLNIEDFTVSNEVKGLKGLLDILNLPNGFNFTHKFQEYKFIQSDKDFSKFYLVNWWLPNSTEKNKLTSILIYNATENTWKDTKLLFHQDIIQVAVTHNDLIYLLRMPGIYVRSTDGYIINVKESKIIKFKPKGEIPLDFFNQYYIKDNNRLFFFAGGIKRLILTVYILNLDTLVWEKKVVDNIRDQTNACLFYYKGYIIFTYGNNDHDKEYTQIIDTKTWVKVDSINKKKKQVDLKELDSQIDSTDNNKNNNQVNKEEGINKSALIGGLIGSAMFIGLIILFIYFYFKKQREFKIIKPPEFITQHEVIDGLDMIKDKKHLDFRFSIKSNGLKINNDWDLKHPEAVYTINKKQD